MNDFTRNYFGIFTFLFFILFIVTSFGQEHTDFKALRSYILSEVAARDINEAFDYVDTLKLLAETKNQAIQADMVLAVLSYQSGNKVQALEIAMHAEEDFLNNKNYSDQIGAIGFIASNFRELGLKDEALYYLNKAKPSIENLSNIHLKGQYGTLMQHEIIGIYLEKKEFQKANQYLQQAYHYTEKINPGKQKDFFLATTIKFDALIEYNLGNYTESKELYNNALTVLNTKDDLLYGEIQLGLANIALKEKNYEASFDYLSEVENMVDASQYFRLKKEFYSTSMDYYEKVGDSINYEKSHYLYLNALHKHDNELKAIANKSLRDLRSKIADNRSSLISYYSTGMVITIMLVIGILIMFIRSKNLSDRYKYVMKQLKVGNDIEEKKFDRLTTNQNENFSVNETISDETEERILLSLIDLENNDNFYSDPEVTLTKLASNFDTNTNYLTHVIRKHRGKNFNTYINDLRVNYILKLLKTKPEYSQYKISYLAEIAGFSSHSKFSTEFKRVVGISPSVFINKLSKKKAESSLQEI